MRSLSRYEVYVICWILCSTGLCRFAAAAATTTPAYVYRTNPDFDCDTCTLITTAGETFTPASSTSEATTPHYVTTLETSSSSYSSTGPTMAAPTSTSTTPMQATTQTTSAATKAGQGTSTSTSTSSPGSTKIAGTATSTSSSSSVTATTSPPTSAGPATTSSTVGTVIFITSITTVTHIETSVSYSVSTETFTSVITSATATDQFYYPGGHYTYKNESFVEELTSQVVDFETLTTVFDETITAAATEYSTWVDYTTFVSTILVLNTTATGTVTAASITITVSTSPTPSASSSSSSHPGTSPGLTHTVTMTAPSVSYTTVTETHQSCIASSSVIIGNFPIELTGSATKTSGAFWHVYIMGSVFFVSLFL